MLSEIIAKAIHAPPLHLYAASVFSGVVLHVAFFVRRVLEEYALEILLTYLALPAGLVCYLSLSPELNLSWNESVSVISRLTVLHILGLFLGSVVYRLFFHPLRHIPAPLGCKLTGWYVVYLAWKSGMKLHLITKEWHDKYGDFVRITPNVVSANHKDVIPILSRASKGNWYLVGGKVGALQTTRHKESHRVRRKVWDKAFTPEALERYTPVVFHECTVLLGRLMDASKKENPAVNIGKLLIYYTFEMMGNLTFTKEYGLMTSEEEIQKNIDSPKVKEVVANIERLELTRESMEIVGLLMHVPYMCLIAELLPGNQYNRFCKWLWEELNERKAREKELEHQDKDIFGWLLEAEPYNLPPTKIAIDQDTRLAIIAGSDTTAATLTAILFYLAANQEKLQRLQREIDQFYPKPYSPSAPNDTFLTEEIPQGIIEGKCAYLQGVINEALRLCPVIPNGVQRVIGKGGCTIENVYLPEGTEVSWPMYTAGRSEKNYSEPNSFIPERWLVFNSSPEAYSTGNGASKDASEPFSASGVCAMQSFQPFWLGSYQCAGKTLAQLQLRLTISRVVRSLDVALEKDESGKVMGDKEFLESSMDCFTMAFHECLVRFTRRGKAEQ